MAQDLVRDPAGHDEDHDPAHRHVQQCRKHERNLTAKAGLEDPRGQARFLARGARHEFGYHGSDQRQSAGNLQTRHEVRQRRGHQKKREALPGAGFVEREEVAQVVIGAAQTDDGAGENGKEGNDPGANQQRRHRAIDIDQDQRRNCDDGCDLKHHRIREQADFHDAGQREQGAETDTTDDGQRQRR